MNIQLIECILLYKLKFYKINLLILLNNGFPIISAIFKTKIWENKIFQILIAIHIQTVWMK